jgi:hypothetical protein
MTTWILTHSLTRDRKRAEILHAVAERCNIDDTVGKSRWNRLPLSGRANRINVEAPEPAGDTPKTDPFWIENIDEDGACLP